MASSEPADAAVDDEDEDAVLQAALAISMESARAPNSAETPVAPSMEVDDEDDEEAALQAAMLLSMADSSPAAPAASTPAATLATPVVAPPAAGTFMDADFVNQLLGSVEVDPNDPFIVAAREQLDAAQSEKNKSEDSKKDETKKWEVVCKNNW